jgi:hypothetical protein
LLGLPKNLLGLTKIVLAKIVTNNHNIKLVMKNYPTNSDKKLPILLGFVVKQIIAFLLNW